MAGEAVTIYTDGACIGNPGPGGYGVVLLRPSGREELSRGFRTTTNNRMELLAAIAGLEALARPCAVTLHSDSRYVVDGMAKGWGRALEDQRLDAQQARAGRQPRPLGTAAERGEQARGRVQVGARPRRQPRE